MEDKDTGKELVDKRLFLRTHLLQLIHLATQGTALDLAMVPAKGSMDRSLHSMGSVDSKLHSMARILTSRPLVRQFDQRSTGMHKLPHTMAALSMVQRHHRSGTTLPPSQTTSKFHPNQLRRALQLQAMGQPRRQPLRKIRQWATRSAHRFPRSQFPRCSLKCTRSQGRQPWLLGQQRIRF